LAPDNRPENEQLVNLAKPAAWPVRTASRIRRICAKVVAKVEADRFRESDLFRRNLLLQPRHNCLEETVINFL
jgi:hypothetical protein